MLSFGSEKEERRDVELTGQEGKEAWTWDAGSTGFYKPVASLHWQRSFFRDTPRSSRWEQETGVFVLRQGLLFVFFLILENSCRVVDTVFNKHLLNEWLWRDGGLLPPSFEFWGQNFCLRHRHMLGWVPFLGHLQSSLVFLLQLIEKLMREANQWLMSWFMERDFSSQSLKEKNGFFPQATEAAVFSQQVWQLLRGLWQSFLLLPFHPKYVTFIPFIPEAYCFLGVCWVEKGIVGKNNQEKDLCSALHGPIVSGQ